MAQSIISATPAVMAMDVHVTGRRVLATIVDGIVLGVLLAVMTILFGESSTSGTSVSFSMGTFPTLGFFILATAYYILMEGYLGQTVGKMLLGIKVVREDTGEVPGIRAAAIRSVLRIVDGLFSYLVAFITVLVSGKNQRLGDMAARTLVVRK
ncbi:MAG: RDD family protein [Chloroflexota bacterium]|nr:RDD family protein [Chloroflexota bacterium]